MYPSCVRSGSEINMPMIVEGEQLVVGWWLYWCEVGSCGGVCDYDEVSVQENIFWDFQDTYEVKYLRRREV